MATDNGNGWLDNYLPYQIYRITNRLNTRLQHRLRALNTSLSQWRVISVLASGGRQSISEIVERTLMEQPTVSRVVSQLEEEGFLVRSQSPNDTRVTDVEITPKGQKLFNEIFPSARQHEEAALKDLKKKDLDALRKTLTLIERNIEW